MTTLKDSKYTEIVATLEQIERTNEILQMYREAHEPSRLTIRSFEDLLDDFHRQLVELLLEFNVRVELRMAA